MTTATLTVTRADNEAEGVDIEVTLSGSLAPAEPDVGIMSPWMIDIYAEDENGNEIELTDRELDLAQEALLQAAAEDAAEAHERLAEYRAEVNQELAESLDRAHNAATQHCRESWE